MTATISFNMRSYGYTSLITKIKWTNQARNAVSKDIANLIKNWKCILLINNMEKRWIIKGITNETVSLQVL